MNDYLEDEQDVSSLRRLMNVYSPAASEEKVTDTSGPGSGSMTTTIVIDETELVLVNYNYIEKEFEGEIDSLYSSLEQLCATITNSLDEICAN
jgi:hypothetical protein